MPDQLVAVTGATGRQGGAVVRHLLADGWQVRALTRRPRSEAAATLAALGAEVVAADMDDPTSLTAAFAGAYGVYSVQNGMTSGLQREVAQGRNVADAALAQGVQHLVYGSAGTGVRGTGIGSWEAKAAVEDHMRTLGLPLTVLRPMAFMELMTDRDFHPALSTWSVMPRLMGEDRPVPWVCADDLGALAARVFGQPERFRGAAMTVAADVRTLAECRELWQDVTGRLPRRAPVPPWLFERLAGRAGRDLTTMWRWLRTGEVPLDTGATRMLLPDASTVEQWLGRRTSGGGDRYPRRTRGR